MSFLRSRGFAYGVVAVTVAAFALAGGSRFGLLIAVAVAVIAWFSVVRKRGPEARLYRRLLKMAHGDRDRVERLIDIEADANPDASRSAHIRGAIKRWERDLN